MGGSLSLGYVKERGLGWNLFAGIRDNSLLYPSGKNWHLGGELELLPIQSHETESGVSVFQAGFLAGLSTISAHPDNWVSLHGGARVNLNFADNVGLSLVYRVNLGYMMGEAAIVTRL
jgi:hypothetical protein